MTAHNRPTRRAALAGGLAGLSTLAVPGARAQTPKPTPKKGGTLVFLQGQEPNSLVSIATTATPSLTNGCKVSEGLLEYDYDITPKPQLATEWKISPDGKEYVFKLRPNVKFHDGHPFSSADVAYSIMALKKVHPRGRNTFANVTEVATPDPLIVVLVLDKSEVAFSFQLVTELRKAGLRAEAYVGESGMKAQLRYADKRNAAIAVIEGSDERAKGEVSAGEATTTAL